MMEPPPLPRGIPVRPEHPARRAPGSKSVVGEPPPLPPEHILHSPETRQTGAATPAEHVDVALGRGTPGPPGETRGATGVSLRLPSMDDLRHPRTLAQVVLGFLCALVHAAVAVWVGGAFGDGFAVVPGLTALGLPLLLVGGFVMLFDARAFGRGFVLGIVVDLVLATAVGFYTALHGGP